MFDTSLRSFFTVSAKNPSCSVTYKAGYLTWEDRSSMHVGSASPAIDPYWWLQTIYYVKLTLAGRDRARGRMITTPLTDPDEDDGRMIAGLTIEEIARSIDNTYTAAQLPRYLRDSGIPVDFVPPDVAGDKWLYMFYILSALHEGGSAARRALREFIGSWLEGRYHAPPSTEIRKRIVALFVQRGWHVDNGRLVVGERQYSEPGTVTPLGRDARLQRLHTDIRQVIERFVEDHLDVAIFEAFKAVNNRVKTMTGLDLDSSKLFDKVFGTSQPMIQFADLTTQTGRDVQQGLYFIFKRAARGIRT